MVVFKDGHPAEKSLIPDGEYLEITEFAKKFGVPLENVRTWVKRRQLPCVSYYGRLFIPATITSISLGKHVRKL